MIPSLVVLAVIVMLLLYVCRGRMFGSNQVVNAAVELDHLEVQAMEMPLTEDLTTPNWITPSHS